MKWPILPTYFSKTTTKLFSKTTKHKTYFLKIVNISFFYGGDCSCTIFSRGKGAELHP